VDDLRDGYGERLWYAVSSKHKGLLNCGPNAACVDMGRSRRSGRFTVRDASGALVHDGRIDDARRAGAGGAAAVVIAPGPPLERREDLAGTVRRMQARETRAQQLDPANYLDKAPAPRSAARTTRRSSTATDAAGRALNGDGFIRGPVRLADGALAVNDRIAAIGYDDLMPRVMRRVANEVAQCLRAHPSAPAARLPAGRRPTRPVRGAPRQARASGGCRPRARGLRPGAARRGAGLVARLADARVLRARRPARGCRRAHSAVARATFAVLVSGAALGAQAHAPGSEPDPAQWLEPPHDALARLDAATGLPRACRREPPCDAGGMRSRRHRAARSRPQRRGRRLAVMRGFTLLELLMVLLVVAILAAGLSMPLAAQVQMRRYDETRRALDEAREALLGFAASSGRLPCPASAASPRRGELRARRRRRERALLERLRRLPARRGPRAGPARRRGLPARRLGTKAHRVRYAVFGGGAAVNGVSDPLTRANGLQMATLPASAQRATCC
jgi:prepilin-type N-terminal cleavage/methylation domain-containing protein